MITIDEVSHVTPGLVAALRGLLSQLTTAGDRVDEQSVGALLADPAVTLLVAHDESRIVGTTTVVCFHKPTRHEARLEDVVVDESARGAGVGRLLVERAVDVARRRGATRLVLQSAPWRDAANRFYPALGFERSERNIYRLDLTAD